MENTESAFLDNYITEVCVCLFLKAGPVETLVVL